MIISGHFTVYSIQLVAGGAGIQHAEKTNLGQLMSRTTEDRLAAFLAMLAAVAIFVGIVYFAAGMLASNWLNANSSTQPGIPEFVTAAVGGANATEADETARLVAAQESMAAFAFWMILVGLATTTVTAVGTIAIFKQIKFGQEALNESKSANLLAAETSKKQLRAYLSISYDALYGNQQSFHFLIHNSGQTPALGTFYFITLEYVSNSDGVVDEIETDHYDWANIPSGHTHAVSVDLPPPNHLPSGKQAPQYDYLSVSIECTYRTVFETEERSEVTINRRGLSNFWMDDDYTVFT